MSVQYDVSRYFPSDSIINQKPIPNDINELIKLIYENKQNLNFIISLYNECFNTKPDDPLFDNHIRESILKYKKPHNEPVIYKKANIMYLIWVNILLKLWTETIVIGFMLSK